MTDGLPSMIAPPGLRRARAKRSDLIADELLRWVVLTGKRPGDRLPQERELVALFSSSRGTIRETLKALEVQGLIEIVTGPQGGARLTRIPDERAMQLLTPYFFFRGLSAKGIYEMRLMLEPLMVEAAIEHLNVSDLDALRATVALCRRGISGTADLATHRAAELQFHAIIADRVPNKLLRFFCLFVNHLIYAVVTPKSVAQGAQRQFADHVVEAHEAIIQALADRDKEKAATLMLEHIADAGEMVEDMELAFDRTFLEQSRIAEQDIAAVVREMSFAKPIPLDPAN